MKLWQKNLLAVLAVSVMVLAAMCALLIADDNQARFQAECEAVEREFFTAMTSLTNSANLYPDDAWERQQAMIRALQVTQSLGGRGKWLLLQGNAPLFGNRADIPLAHLPPAEKQMQCAFYEGQQGPVFVCTQQEGDFSLYGAWDGNSLFLGGRQRASRMGWMLIGAATALALLLFLLSRKMFRPLRQLEKGARAIASGNYALRIPPSGASDLDALSDSFHEMAAAVQSHITALEKENEQQRRFVANLAHEMKTPMTAMIGYSDLLLQSRVAPEQRQEAYQYISQQARRLNELSQKLMALSRLSQQEELAFSPLSMRSLFEEAAQTARPLMENKGLLFQLPPEDVSFQGEEGLLISLLTNLLTNACKASSPGGRIICQTGRDQKGIFAAVSDEGGGVPDEALSLLTDPFYMVDKSRARKENGAGIGLTLCREIARLHGGEMQFVNLQPGFRAVLRLPTNLQIDDISNTTP